MTEASHPGDANLDNAFFIGNAGFLRAGEITRTTNDLIHGHTEFPLWILTP